MLPSFTVVKVALTTSAVRESESGCATVLTDEAVQELPSVTVTVKSPAETPLRFCVTEPLLQLKE